MREIKFRRAFFTDAEKTKFSHFDTWGVGVDNASFKSPGSNNFAIYFEDQQYTGLKDKNGKEIYEGDIRGGTYYCDNEQVSTLEVIEWDNDGMCFWWRRLKGGSMPDFIETEIVGNIYQHPELLQP